MISRPRAGFKASVRFYLFGPQITLRSPAGRRVQIRVYERLGSVGEALTRRHFAVRSRPGDKTNFDFAQARKDYWGTCAIDALAKAEELWGILIDPPRDFGTVSELFT